MPATKKASKKKPAAKTSSKKASGQAPAGEKPSKKAVAGKKSAASPEIAPKTGIKKAKKKIIAPYKEKKGEEYMNQDQLEHFRKILLSWKRELMEEVDRTVHHMKEDASNFADPSDRATQEEEFSLELRTRDRERKLLRKINAALLRIDDGSYGYCSETGEEIGIRRLEARPVATLCLEAQQRREMAKRQFRDREERDH